MKVIRVEQVNSRRLRAKPGVIQMRTAVEIAQGKPVGESHLVAGVFFAEFEATITIAYHFANQRWTRVFEHPSQERADYLSCDDLPKAIRAFETMIGVVLPEISIVESD